jgi:hypothetical protein
VVAVWRVLGSNILAVVASFARSHSPKKKMAAAQQLHDSRLA